MQIKSAEYLFERQLSLVNNAEEQLSKALPRWAEASDRKALTKALTRQTEENQEQLERLERVAENIENTRLKRIKDTAFAALVTDADEMIESTDEGAVRDAALIGAVRKIKHYEIAAYKTLRVLAKQLDYSKVRALLKATLEEEQAADEKLHDLLKKKINLAAN